MADFGFQIFRPDGSLLLSNQSVGFTLLDVVPVGAGGPSGSKSYPGAAGFTLLTTQIANHSYEYESRFHGVSVDYSSGYPILYWTILSPSAGADIYVFAR